jgi:hypothetical protein
MAGNNGSIPPTRPTGSKNKVNGEAKRMVLSALESVGGIDWLIALAKHEPRSFASIIQKLIPTEVAAKVESDVVLKLNVHRYEEEETVAAAQRDAIESFGPTIGLGEALPVDERRLGGDGAEIGPGRLESEETLRDLPDTPVDRTTLTEDSRQLLFESDSDFDNSGPPGEGLSDTEDPGADVEPLGRERPQGAETPPPDES